MNLLITKSKNSLKKFSNRSARKSTKRTFSLDSCQLEWSALKLWAALRAWSRARQMKCVDATAIRRRDFFSTLQSFAMPTSRSCGNLGEVLLLWAFQTRKNSIFEGKKICGENAGKFNKFWFLQNGKNCLKITKAFKIKQN